MHDWSGLAAQLDAPCALLGLDDFDANAADLVARAAGRPIRVASKSLRCRPLLERVLAREGFAGVLAYSVREAVWLAGTGIDDVFVAYPSVDRGALAELAGDAGLRRSVTLTVDSVEGVDALAATVGRRSDVAVALDVDAALRVGPLHLGARRSPLRTAAEALAVARAADAAGLRVVGVMCYDAQVAGLPDSGPLVRAVKRASLASLARRRREIVTALRAVADLRFVNVGGTGSLHHFPPHDDDVITEFAAGSGLYGPHLFDGYDAFTPRPALQLALPVVRRPGRGRVTLYCGGYVASGAGGRSRLPRPVSRALALSRSEGAGEVQTPVCGRAADDLRIGDRVLVRPAKAGETLERFDVVHLVGRAGAAGETARAGRSVAEGDSPAGAPRLVGEVATYRGEGRNFG